jgi:hypothetical protein
MTVTETIFNLVYVIILFLLGWAAGYCLARGTKR